MVQPFGKSAWWFGLGGEHGVWSHWVQTFNLPVAACGNGFNLLVSLCLRSDTLDCKECDTLMNAQHTGNEMSLPLIILLGFKSHKAFYMLLT